MSMADIGDFEKRVVEKFQQDQDVYVASERGSISRFNLEIAPEAVKDLVRKVYYASMISDEGRYPFVLLMSYRRDNLTGIHVPTCPPRELSAEEIAKLAHAVAPGSHLCIVFEDGKASLGGIQITVLDEMRQFGYASYRIGNPLRLVIRGPGYIEVSTGGCAIIFRAGEIIEDKPLQESDVMRALATTLTGGFEGQTAGVIESLEDVFNDLAEEVVRLGHGGLLLFVKNPDPAQFSSARNTDY